MLSQCRHQDGLNQQMQKDLCLECCLFGMIAKEWREANPDKKGNIRDYATINELICLSNMENLKRRLKRKSPERYRTLYL